MNKPYRRVGRHQVDRHRGALRPLCNIMPIGVTRWPGMLTLVAVLLAIAPPALGEQIDIGPLGDLPIIGVTPSKSTGANLSSRGRTARTGGAAFAMVAGGLAEGDTYNAFGIYNATPNAFVLDLPPDTHTFGMPFDEDAGENFFSLVPMRIHGEDRGAGVIPDQQGTNLITVSYFTVDMSPLLPLGSVFSPQGTIIDGWGLQVGSLDPIEFGAGATFVVHDSGIQLIDNTIADPLQRIVADFDIVDTSTPPDGGLSGRGGAVVPGRAGGIPIDELVMYWDVTVVIIPEPSTSVLLVLGAAGLAVGWTRRRRG